MISPEQFEALLPLACEWAQQQEVTILRDGVPLTGEQICDARTIGVAQPDRVRLLEVNVIPLPKHPGLRTAAQATHLITPNTIGMTFRHGIFIRSEWWGDRRLIAHELVHTSQYERLGGIQPFLAQYLHECITVGYPAAPLEQEAIATAQRVCGK
jgi:hypothetical protein